jgi:hypothetical protein
MMNATLSHGNDSAGGTIAWTAPELLNPTIYAQDGGHTGEPTKQSDMYAFAITIWEVRPPV